MFQSDQYQETLHTQSTRGGTATLEHDQRDDGLSPSDRLVAALRRQIELDNEEPERWDGMS